MKEAIEGLVLDDFKDKLFVYRGAVECNPNGSNRTTTVTLDMPLPDHLFTNNGASYDLVTYSNYLAGASSNGRSNYWSNTVSFTRNISFRRGTSYSYKKNGANSLALAVQATIYPTYIEFLCGVVGGGVFNLTKEQSSAPVLIIGALKNPRDLVDEYEANIAA